MKRRQFLKNTLGSLGALAAAGPARALPLSEFKLGIINSEISDDVEEALRFIQSYGLKWAQIKVLWGKYNAAQDTETVKRARRLVDQYGLRVSLLCTAFFKCPLPPPGDERKKVLKSQYEILETAIANARILGTNKIRAFAFTNPGRGENRWSEAMEHLREAARIAESEGVYLAVENVFGAHVATGAEVKRMLDEVPSKHVGLIWEPNNAAMAGDFTHLNGLDFVDPKRILDVHLRDGRHDENKKFTWCAVGDGELDVAGTLKQLRSVGYNGTFTLETHYTPPGGTKKDGSKRSIEGLLKVIDSL
jgi:L-ribulose-5-phosphate 3-epimerase